MANTFSAVMTAYRLAREADPELRAGLLDGAMAMEEQLNNCAAEGYPGIAHDMLTLTAQRDALKAVAESLVAAARPILTTLGNDPGDPFPLRFEPLVEQARAALAPVKS